MAFGSSPRGKVLFLDIATPSQSMARFSFPKQKRSLCDQPPRVFQFSVAKLQATLELLCHVRRRYTEWYAHLRH